MIQRKECYLTSTPNNKYLVQSRREIVSDTRRKKEAMRWHRRLNNLSSGCAGYLFFGVLEGRRVKNKMIMIKIRADSSSYFCGEEYVEYALCMLSMRFILA